MACSTHTSFGDPANRHALKGPRPRARAPACTSVQNAGPRRDRQPCGALLEPSATDSGGLDRASLLLVGACPSAAGRGVDPRIRITPSSPGPPQWKHLQLECRMSSRLFLVFAGSFVVGCAPAIPARPALPPVSAGIASTEARDPSAPVVPKPDLSTVTNEIRAAAGPGSDAARAAKPGRR